MHYYVLTTGIADQKDEKREGVIRVKTELTEPKDDEKCPKRT